jgi:thiol-disulfide isomerase/thioredoxin
MNKIIISLLTISLFFGCNNKNDNKNTQVQQKSQEIKKNKKEVIKFTLTTVDNKTFHLIEIPNGFEIKELKDKVVFLIFFGHQCPPCLREIPRLIEIKKEHKDLEIIAIEVQGLSTQELKKFKKSKGINYNLISMGSSMNFINYIQAKAGWNGSIPFLISFNKKGKVAIIQVGGLLKKHLEQVYTQTNK